MTENDRTGRWEVPTERDAEEAQRIFDLIGIENIRVKVVPVETGQET